jgi:hypothetical protein
MCAVAPILLPGLAGAAPVASGLRATVEGAPAARPADVDAAVRPPIPAGPTPLPSTEFLALSPQEEDADVDDVLRRIRLPAAASLAPPVSGADKRSYG